MVIQPSIDRGNDWFWEGVDKHRLLLQRCSSCGSLRYPAAPMCGACQSLEWIAQKATGRGSIHSWIVSHHPTGQGDSRIVVLVDLDEGVRMVSNIVDAEYDEMHHELPVELTFRTYDDVTLPQFKLVR